ncbi:GNAT family N-acetyltransferase [Nocardioides gilvus]|uniref:GNAT family N-acetyltransferase n=1 Tax=Nocardioides gilvus TaxID=1735589 RepID=UPI000D74B241|nr:GNAT family N-acetyltransferase [Nocardioides gilvus]
MDTPTAAQPSTHLIGEHTLGPHVVGTRVVVRRVLPGQVGPSGGPAMTDTLGVCRSWARGLCEVETAEGTVVAIHIGDIVSGKPVPPRPSVRLRTTPREAHLRTLALWPEAEQQRLGDWVLRAAGAVVDSQHQQGRLVRRANSVLAIGDPAVPTRAAAAAVVEFYAARHQPALAQVVVGDEIEAALTELGWTGDDSGISLFQVGALSRVLRSLGPARDRAVLEETAGEATGVRHATVRLDRDASVRDASVRVALEGDWVGVSDLWVAPERRRQGLAREVLSEAFDWAASLGATTAHLQVSETNTAAVQLYATAGFSTHHAYRYLVAP